MPLITVDDQGNSLYYEDSGAPPNSESLYATLIIVHGTSFHGQIFRRLLPLAAQHNIRLVLVNRRDYPHSSPYTEEDLEKVRVDSVDTHDKFAKARAVEFARFIKVLVEKEKLPRASGDWKRGGVVLLSWSSGNGYTLPLLAYVDSIPEDERSAIEPYLRSHIVFDAPRWILGVNPVPDVLRDPNLSEEERVRRFNDWVSAYYTHKSVTSRSKEDLEFVAPSGPKITRRSTVEAMTPEELEETTYPSAIPRSEIAARTASPAIYAERIRRVLFDDDLAKNYLPRVGVDVVWCEKSTSVCIDAAWEFQKEREKADEGNIGGRKLNVIMMPGANHFPHWDEPEKTMAFLKNVIDPPMKPGCPTVT